jgi:general secretion pathway protein M
MKPIKLPSISLSSLPSFSGLNRRERLAVYGAGLAVFVFIVVQFIIFPVFDSRTTLRREIDKKRLNLSEIHQLKAEHDALTQTNRITDTQLKKRAKNFTLFSFLDNLAGKSGIKQNIVYMKPSTSNLKNSPYTLSIVEIKVQSLTMEQTLNFLHGIEMSGNHVWVKRMSLTRDEKKEGLLNSTIQVETYQS